MAKQKYKTVYLSDEAEAKKIYNALEESGQLEAAIKLTKETALKYAKKSQAGVFVLRHRAYFILRTYSFETVAGA